MRSVIVSDFGSVNGGAAKVAIESARGLAEAGVDVVFAYAVGEASPRLDHPRISVERFRGEEVWAIGSRIAAARQGIWNGEAHGFLTKLLARQPRDTIVHLHQWTKAFSPAAIAAAGESGLQVALTLHDYFGFCPTGGYFDFRAGRPCALKPMSASCITANCDRASYVHKLVRVARQWRSDEALRALRSPLVIHVSGFARGVAEPFLPRGARHATVENMVEVERRTPSTVADNAAAIFVGRMTQEKGVLVLAEAARMAGMPLRFVGDGESGIVQAVAARNPEAVITGWTDAAGVEAELATARCLVAPSLWYETGPLSVIEAMARGIPAVASRKIGAAGRVRDGIDGLLVDEPSVASLAAALRRMADDETACRLGLAAYEAYWSRPPTLAAHVEALLAAYRDGLAAAA